MADVDPLGRDLPLLITMVVALAATGLLALPAVARLPVRLAQMVVAPTLGRFVRGRARLMVVLAILAAPAARNIGSAVAAPPMVWLQPPGGVSPDGETDADSTPPVGTETLPREVGDAVTGDRHVVVRGDNLWAIACRRLQAAGLPTSKAAIDREWRRIYAANVDVVGSDPDLIFPGQALTLPPLSPP